MNSKVKKVIFPVAGLGTRFLPATKSIPKEIMTLVDRPLIQYAMDEAVEAGIEQFIFVTSRGKSALEDYFDHAPNLERTLKQQGKTELLKAALLTRMPSGSIAYIRQNKPIGLGHAVHCASKLIGDEPFAVMLTDDVILSGTSVLRQMLEAHAEVGGTMVALTEIPDSECEKYGLVKVGKRRGRIAAVSDMVEKPKPADAPSNLAIVGRYILTPRILKNLELARPGSGGEIQLTDAISQEARQSGTVHGYLFEGRRFDCGSKQGFLEATVAAALARSEFRSGFRTFLQGILEDESLDSTGGR